MFTQTWKKYLPVIILLMKRSDKAEQVLDMNYTDFARAAAGKKNKTHFFKCVVNEWPKQGGIEIFTAGQ